MRFFITLTLLLLCCIEGYAQQRLYLVAGQSNARGRGNDTFSVKIDTLTSYEYDPFSGQLIHLEDPVGYSGGGFEQAATGSAWPAFAKSYHDLTADTTVLIPAARGGSGVHYSSSSPGANWSSSGLLYPLSKIKIDDAKIVSDLNLHGIVWMQGETDAARIGNDYLTKEQYKEALIDLIDRYRNDYGCALPFYIVLIGTNLEDPVWGYDTVRVVQREIAAEQQHTYIVHEDAQYFGDIDWMWDNVHYTQDGYNDIGKVGASNVVAIENQYYTVSVNRTDTICPGDSVLLSAPPMYQSYLWSSGETQREIYATSGGQYTVTVTDDIGCSFPLDSVYVQAYEQARPTISTFGNDTLCLGENLLLVSSTAPGYLWSTGETEFTINIDSPGDYFVQTIDNQGCLSEPSDTISVTVIDFAEIPISMDGTPDICEGDSVVLTAPFGFDTYQWSNGDTTQSITVYESGTFDCVVSTFGCDSPPSESVSVVVHPLAIAPTITTFGPEDLCEGDSLTLTASSEFDRYLWSTGDTTQSITVHESGIYTCVFIGTNGCLGNSSSPLLTIFNPLPSKPTIEVDGNTEFCSGESVILNVPTNYEAYLWSNGATTPSITVQNSGTFSCYVTASNGCDSPPSDSIDILVHPAPSIPIITKDGSPTFCEGENVILTASSGYNSYQWSNGETTQSITVYDSGEYTCTVTDINDCTSISAPENITATPAPSAPNITTDGPLIFCEGEQVVLTAPSDYSAYSWSNGETTQSITISESGTYDCTVVNDAGCESPPSETLTVTVISNDVPPTISLSGPTTFCEGESLTLSAPFGFSTYQWSNGETTPSITVSDSGMFSCIITSGNGCESPPSDTVFVTVNPLPAAPFITTNDSTICEEDSTTLTVTENADSYQWSTGETTQSITVYDSGTYNCLLIDENGCTSPISNSITIDIASINVPTITADGPTTFCEGENVTLSVPDEYATYQWSNGDNTSSITVEITGEYSCTVTNTEGCTSKTITPITVSTISVASAPSIEVNGSTMLCEGETVTLTAPSGFANYQWSNGETTPSITVDDSGAFTCIITSNNDCESPPSDTIFVTVNPLPAAPVITTNDSTICEGDSTTLTVSENADSYQWSTGETTQNITVYHSGTYNCLLTDANGCTSPISNSITIDIAPINVPTITADGPTTFCEGEFVTLAVPDEYATYQWSNGETTPNITVSIAGEYSCTVTNTEGCTSKTITPITVSTISVASAPSIEVNGSTMLCEGETITLTAPPGFTNYQWSNGETTQSITVDDAGAFTCIVTSSNDCESPPSDAIFVTVNPLPPVPLITPDGMTTFCEGNNVTLTAPIGFDEYQWSNGEITQSITVDESGNYDCIVTNSEGCQSPVSEPVTITVNELPTTPIITSDGATTFCDGGNVTLTAPMGFDEYQWSNGETTQSITVDESGNYDCIVTNSEGCESPVSESVTVTINDMPTPPIIALDGTTTFCEGGSVTLTAPMGFEEYQWSNGETTQSITVNESGNYDCKVINSEGCESPVSESVTVTVNELPVAPNITPDGATTFCEGNNVTLTAPMGFDEYQWSNGETTQSITVDESGNYDCIVINSQGCESPVSEPVTITVNELPTVPTITLDGTTTFCEGGNVTLTAPMGFDEYQWSNGEMTQSITVHESGTYDCIVINSQGCESPISEPVTITVNELPVAPNITPDGATTFCQGDSVTLNAPMDFDEYHWSNGETTQSITVHESGNYEYFVINSEGCQSPISESVAVTVNELPIAPTITPDGATTFCEGENVMLTAPIGFDEYKWSNGETTQSITINESGIYDCIVTNANGCISPVSTPIEVIVNTLPSVPIIQAIGAPSFCEGDSVVLVVPGGYSSYTWSNGEVGQTITVYNTGTFYCKVSNQAGCVNTSTAFSTTRSEMLPKPEITYSGATEFCEGESVTVFAESGYANYLWSTGATTQDITISESSDSLYCIVSDNNDCASPPSDMFFVVVNPLPEQPYIDTIGTTSFCLGNTVQLSASEGYAHAWSTGETTESITVSSSGIYTVQVFSDKGCESEVAVPVEVIASTPPERSTIDVAGSTSFCKGDSVVLSALPSATYLWSSGDTTQSIIVEQAGVFSCIVIDSLGCQSEPSFDITTEVFDNPLPPTISILGDSILCPGDTAIIQAFSDSQEYFWSNGEVGKEIIVTTEGEYRCYVRDENDCKSELSDSVKTELLPLPPVPNIQSSGDLTLCEGDSVTLSADSGYLTYLWSTGDTTTNITVDYAGEFHYITTDSTSCSDPISKSINIEVNPIPDNPFIIPIGIDTLCASEIADEYHWYRNDTLTAYNTRCIIPDTDGTWQVTTVLENCLSSYSAGFYFELPPETGGGPASLDLYPNPNHGFLTIEAKNIFEHSVTFEIYDMLGRVLFSEELAVQNEPVLIHTIDIRKLPSAPYVAVLTAGTSERFVRKFVVDGE